ncbi:glycosyltransferase family 4 protein [Aeribacillus alveayuensis]|uniref:Glycosyltransferase involved in cell wall biosynthesis n=1 Tax=Aeribacillus alveayuensis TaxID=279215 RepID=A0ABT9VNN2_9BACI|nr:glycosyltransferase involved in cell wall biosynthesis [Bacillus alveayuensis]
MTSKYNVLIDGYYLNKNRGLGRYVKELLFSLGKFNDTNINISVMVPSSIKSEEFIFPEKISYFTFPKLPFPLWEQLLIPYIVKKMKPDVFHSPYNTKPLLFNKGFQSHVVTIHDLMYMEESHKSVGLYQKIGNKYRKWVVSRIVDNGQKIVTVSKKSKNDIMKHLGFESSYIYTPVEYTYSCLKNKQINIRSNKENYFFHVGGTSPHKNTEKCIKAFLASELEGYKLIVSGMGKECDLCKKYESEKVYFTGWISDEEIAAYYKNAKAVVFPSLKEGYGLPIIEAFTFGIPVITSNLDPMMEIAGNAAVFVNPFSLESILNALNRIAKDDDLRKQLIKNGQKRIEQISSKNMAKSMYKIYMGAITNEKSCVY